MMPGSSIPTKYNTKGQKAITIPRKYNTKGQKNSIEYYYFLHTE